MSNATDPLILKCKEVNFISRNRGGCFDTQLHHAQYQENMSGLVIKLVDAPIFTHRNIVLKTLWDCLVDLRGAFRG